MSCVLESHKWNITVSLGSLPCIDNMILFDPCIDNKVMIDRCIDNMVMFDPCIFV